MASVSGLLKIGEAQAAVNDIGTRQRGSRFFYYSLMIVIYVVGCVGGALTYHSNPVIGGCAGVILGAVVYVLICKRLTVIRFRRRMSERGFSPHLPLRLEITDDAIEYEVGEVHHIAKWPAVTELFRSHGYWIFLVQASPFFAPQRFFADREAEIAFIKAALSRMSAAARQRSASAVQFVGQP